MARATSIIRRSIHAFFQSYQSLAAAATLFVLPFSAIILLSQAFTPSSTPILQTLTSRMHALFQAAGFPATSQFFSLLNLKLSQTVFSFLFCLPITLTFFVLGKAAIVMVVLKSPRRMITIPSFESLLRLYCLLLPTHLFNSFVVLSANAAVFSLLFVAFNALDIFKLSSDNYLLGLSAASAVLYSIVLANTTVACSLAMIISAMENCRGYLPILKACVLIQGKEATAITLALPASLGMAAVEALFQYRIVRPYLSSGRFSVQVAGEASLIAYMYSLVIMLDTIISCMLYRSFKSVGRWSYEDGDDEVPELEEKLKGFLPA